MKRKSIKTAIILPSLAVLLVGIVAMVLVVGTVASSRTTDLSERLVDARVNEYSNVFDAMTVETYSVVNSLTPLVAEQSVGGGGTGDRALVNNMLVEILRSNESMIGVWTCWEPNAFDGRDREYVGAPESDDTGRMISYAFRDGGSIGVEGLVDYEDPVAGEFYVGPRASKAPYITTPTPTT